jgi:hypothetical protein
MSSTYEPIATTTATGSPTSITFSSIPSTYTDLVLVANIQHSSNSGDQMRLGNGSLDTGSNYSNTKIYGTSSSNGSTRGSNASSIDIAAVAISAPNSGYFAPLIINIQNYANTSTNKTVIARYNDAGGELNATVGLWRSTSAIDTVSLFPGGGISYNNGCVFTLYGIKAE